MIAAILVWALLFALALWLADLYAEATSRYPL